MKKTNKSERSVFGFTLVELVVSITIIWILATVGFISYSWYLTSTRDAGRISQIVKLSDAIKSYSTKGRLPIPDDSIEITASGKLIWYQWYIWKDVLETIGFSNWWTDPKDGSYHTYYLGRDRQGFQLLTFLEEEIGISGLYNWSTTHALEYDIMYPKVYGKDLWVLTESGTNTPVQAIEWLTEIDVVWESTNSYIAHLNDNEKIEWMGTELHVLIPNSSCTRIRELWQTEGNGMYRVNPKWYGEFDMFCNMEAAGWGWTLMARSSVFWWEIDFQYGWGTEYDISNYNYAYASEYTGEVPHTHIMMATYKDNINNLQVIYNEEEQFTGTSAWGKQRFIIWGVELLDTGFWIGAYNSWANSLDNDNDGVPALADPNDSDASIPWYIPQGAIFTR